MDRSVVIRRSRRWWRGALPDLVQSLTVLAAASAMASSPSSLSAQDTGFERAIETTRQAVRDGASSSYAVAVAKNGRIIFEARYGWADRDRRVPADEHTISALASITKSFTATGFMTLAERAEVELDAPINRYLYGARLTGLAGDPERATVARVMTHMSGLPLHYEAFYEGDNDPVRPMDATIARYGVLVNPPGKVYQYSNLGYGILEEVIAQTSGGAYAAFMRERVFNPLDLTRTAVHLTPEPEPFASQRYARDGSRIPFYDSDHDGASAVWSSAHDVVRFGMFHLGQVLPDRKEIISEETQDQMKLPRSSSGPSRSGRSFRKSLGWSVSTGDGRRGVWDGGGMPGVSTMLGMYPDDSVVVVVLSNQPNDRVSSIADSLEVAEMPSYATQLVTSAPQRNASAEREPFDPPAELVGEWEGELRTYQGPVPMSPVVQREGDVHVRISDQLKTLMNEPSFTEDAGGFTGRFAGSIPAEDARRHRHSVLLQVHRRGDIMSGQVPAHAEDYFSLTSYIELRKR